MSNHYMLLTSTFIMELVLDEKTEKVSKLLHEFWIELTQGFCRNQYYDVATHLRNHFAEKWIPYENLGKNEKEKYRTFAKRFVELLER